MAIENVNQKPAAASAALADYLIASIGGKVRRVPINTLADILTDAEVGIINAAAEALISAAGKSSYIGTNGNWFVWDGKKNAFVDSGKPSRGEKGDMGVIFTPHLSEDGILSWTNNGKLPNPKPVKLSGAGEVTAESIKEALGYTPIGEDDLPISSVNGQTGTVKTSWYFEVTGSVASPATMQTVAQIVAAQKAGFAPICSATFSDFQGLPATLPALLISDMACVFGGIGSTGGDVFYLTVMIDGAGTLTAKTDSITVQEADIQTALGYKPIGADDVPVKKVNGAIGNVKSTFYVTITSAEDESISADKSLREIYAAYEAGYTVYAKIASSPQIILPLTIAVHSGNDYAVVFNGAVTFGDTTEYAISNEGSGWTIYAKDIAFKDNIPDIPAVTTADNGKILRVVNGAWAAVEIANANGGSF